MTKNKHLRIETIFKTIRFKNYADAFLNKWVLSFDLSVSIVWLWRMSAGRLFQRVGAAMTNEQSARVFLDFRLLYVLNYYYFFFLP